MTAPSRRDPFETRVSPSRLANLELCPCFDYPDRETQYANEGIKLHKAFETGDLSGLDAEQTAGVTEVLQYTDALLAGLSGRGVRVEDYREKVLTCPPLPGRGFADRVVVVGDEGHVIDAKFGRNAAPFANVNFQGQCYVMGLALERTELRSITFHIVQPRCVPQTTRHTYLVPGALPEIRARIAATLTAVRHPFKQPRMHLDLCNTCRYLSECPAASGILAPIGSESTSLAASPPMVRVLLATPVGRLTGVQRGQLLALFELFDAAMTERKGEVLRGAREGLAVEYYTLRKRKGNASISDPVTAFRLMAALLDEDQILGACNMSVGRLVDAVASKLSCPKTEAEDHVREALAPATTSGPEIAFLQRKRGITARDMLAGTVAPVAGDDPTTKQLNV